MAAYAASRAATAASTASSSAPSPWKPGVSCAHGRAATRGHSWGLSAPLLAKQNSLAVEARRVLRARPARELGSFSKVSQRLCWAKQHPTRLGSATCLAALRRVAVRRTLLDGVVRCSPW